MSISCSVTRPIAEPISGSVIDCRWMGGGAGFSGLLDQFPGAAGGYSLRRLSKAAGPVVRLRRAIDGIESDFTAGEVTDGTAEAWSQGGDAFVATLYDQSGSGNDATQSTHDAQPKLITAGVVEVDNQRPTMVFDGVDDTLTVTMNGFAHTDSFYVMGTDDDKFYFPSNRGEGSGWAGWLADVSSTSTNINGGQYNSGSNAMRLNGADQTPTTRQDVHALLATGTQLLMSDIHATTATWTAFNWGAEYTSAEYGGRLQEWIIYGSDQAASRVYVEANINNHYGVFQGFWYDAIVWDDNGNWQN